MSSTSPLIYDPLMSSIKVNPFPYYSILRKDHPVYWMESMQGFAVSRYDDIVDVLSDGEVYSSGQFWPALLGEFDPVPEANPMISLDPPAHTQLRKLANKAFTPPKVNAMKDKIYRVANELVDDLIKKYGDSGSFDFVWEFTALFPVTVIGDVLGVDLERRMEFKHWVDDILSASNRSIYGPEKLAQIRKSSDDARAYFVDLYQRRKANPGDDLVSGFIAAEVDGHQLNMFEVLSLTVLLLIGGVETTTNLLGNTFGELRRRPSVYKRVRADHSLIPPLLEEVLRHNSSVQMVFRHTTRDTELAGVKIPKGSLVIPLLGSGNRDEGKFPDPDEFDIDRVKTDNILSFGAGPHFCLGAYLSRLESRIGIEVLLTRFAELMPIADNITYMDQYFARGPQTMPVTFKAA
jgi:cytochrome P450